MNSRQSRSLILAFCLGSVTAHMQATPVEPTDAGAAEATRTTGAETTSGKLVERATSPELPGGNRTVDLLIELQPKNSGLGFSETNRAETRANQPPPKSAAESPAGSFANPANQTGLFGFGAVQISPPSQPTGASDRPREADWRSKSSGGESSAAPAPAGAARQSRPGASNDDESVSIPRAVVAWIRGNRNAVVGGALAMLLAIWGASMAKAKKRR